MSDPAVSVVIPTYNRADFILESVTSVLDQTFQDFEVVVVDDGSSDNTPALIRSVADSRIRYLYQVNKGVAAALNMGWRAARGDYIGRLDSDDRWHPDLLMRLVPTLESNPAIGLAYARAQWMDQKGRRLPQMLGAPEKFPNQTLKSLLYGDFVCPVAVIFRRACIEQVNGYDETLIANEDWDLWIRMSTLSRFAYLEEVLADYRTHPGNLTSSASLRLARLTDDRVRVLDKFYSNPEVPRAAWDIKQLAYRNVYMDIAMRWLYAGHWRTAMDYAGKAIRASPHRPSAAIRLLYLVIFQRYLSKMSWGNRLVGWAVARRRSLAREADNSSEC